VTAQTASVRREQQLRLVLPRPATCPSPCPQAPDRRAGAVQVKVVAALMATEALWFEGHPPADQQQQQQQQLAEEGGAAGVAAQEVSAAGSAAADGVRDPAEASAAEGGGDCRVPQEGPVVPSPEQRGTALLELPLGNAVPGAGRGVAPAAAAAAEAGKPKRVAPTALRLGGPPRKKALLLGSRSPAAGQAGQHPAGQVACKPSSQTQQ